MLIDHNTVIDTLRANHIHIDGCFHIGAHDCEEMEFYNKLGVPIEQIVWIDAVEAKVSEAQNRHIPNVYNAVITDTDDVEVVFNLSNNIQSSSILEFGTHSHEHPWVVYVDQIKMRGITVDTFFQRNNLDSSKYNFWNFDIQGAELLALTGAIQSIRHAKALYLEVNEKELYKKCALIGEIDAFLSQYGFSRVLTTMTLHGWGDALYISNQSNQSI